MQFKHGCVPLLFLIAGVPAFAAGHPTVPPASFLNYHAASVRELSQEVTLDPIVRLRLARHFHLTQPTMTSYIRHNLALSHLKKTGYYQVACVRPDGTEYWIREHLPSGTPIFASRITGQPILKLACGNPMVSALPPAARGASVKEAADASNQQMLPQLAETPAADTPARVQTAALTSPELMPDATATDAVLASNDLVTTGVDDQQDLLPVVRTAGSFESLSSVAGAAGGFNFGPALAGLAGSVALLSLNNSGHSNNSSGTSSIPKNPAPVPETSTSAALGVMLVGGALLVIRRKKLNSSL